jgi:tetratricopeptide (TPR) repeat protein
MAPATMEQLQREAELVAEELVERFPKLPEALHVLAILRAQLRQTAEAEKLWRKCIEMDPRHGAYYVNLAAVAMDRGNSELAAKTLQQAVDAGCGSPDVYHHLAVSLTNLGRLDEAEKIAARALQDSPKSAAHWLVLGQAQLQSGKAAEAETSVRTAMELGNRSAEVLFALASACARQGKHREAESYQKAFTELKASQTPPVAQRFQVLTTAEARRTAVAVLTEAAAVHTWQKDSLEAERLLLRAITLDPGSAASCRALAGVYHQAGMAPEERVVRRRLIEIEPFHFDNYVDLAKVSAELGEPETAEAALKMAIAIRPAAADGYAALAQFHLQQGKPRQARWFAQEAVRRAPTAEGFRFLATACRLAGDDTAADAALAVASSLGAETPPPSHRKVP